MGWHPEHAPLGDGLWYVRRLDTHTKALCPPGMRLHIIGANGHMRTSTSGWREATWCNRPWSDPTELCIDTRSANSVVQRFTWEILDRLPAHEAEGVWLLMLGQLLIALDFGHAVPGRGLPDEQRLAGAQTVDWFVHELTEAFPARRSEIDALLETRRLEDRVVPDDAGALPTRPAGPSAALGDDALVEDLDRFFEAEDSAASMPLASP